MSTASIIPVSSQNNTKLNHEAHRPASFQQPLSLADIVDQFRQAMLEHGIHYRGPIIPDGKLHRFHIEGHRMDSRNGAYLFHGDERPAGYFEDFRAGVKGTWSVSRSMSAADARRFQAEIAEARHRRETERQQEQARAEARARYIWEEADPATSHPYLTAKRVKPHGTRIHKGSLVAPVFNRHGDIVSLQFIDEDGNKRFLSGGQKKGCFSKINGNFEKLLIAEGFATAASLGETTGHCVFVAFDASNLLHVARAVRNIHPHGVIIICGDNDLSGVGQRYANEAALAVGGKVLIPPTPGDDWNDFLTEGGLCHV